MKVDCKNKTMIISFIILLSKYFIYKCKYDETQPSIGRFNTYMKQIIKIEETIATIKNKLDTFHSKWSDFIEQNT